MVLQTVLVMTIFSSYLGCSRIHASNGLELRILITRDAVIRFQLLSDTCVSLDRPRHEYLLLPRATHSGDNTFMPLERP